MHDESERDRYRYEVFVTVATATAHSPQLQRDYDAWSAAVTAAVDSVDRVVGEAA